MIAVIVCGDLRAERPGEATREHFLSRPCAAAAHSKHAGGNSPIFQSGAFASVRGRLGITAARGCGTNNLRQPASNFFLGSARVQACQQSPRAFANALHLPSSFQTASASYEQKIIGAFGNVRKAFGEIRNVEC